MTLVDGGVLVVTESRPVLAGFTTFTSNGAIGGRTTANARCSAEFPGTHLCTQSEFRAARSAIPLPPPGAFLDYAINGMLEPDFSAPCANFASATTMYSASIALPSGAITTNTSSLPNCTSTLPLACCTTPSPVRLRGFTAFTTNGAIGGRTTANARCSTEFPGSHLCTHLEFRAARSSLPLSPPGAFLDYTEANNPQLPDFTAPCSNFSSATTMYSASVALPSGVITTNTSSLPNCTSTMPLACCD